MNWAAAWGGGIDPSANTDFNTNGVTDAAAGKVARHDPLTDIVFLRDDLAAIGLAPGNAVLVKAANQIKPVVACEFSDYSYYRGWVYFELLDLAALDPSGGWLTRAKAMADSIDQGFFDASLGALIDPAHKNYETDDAAESAAMLVDAGKRFGEPTLSAHGAAAAAYLLAHAPDPTTGIFPFLRGVSAAGDVVTDPTYKVGAEAQTLDAVLTIYDITGAAQYLDAAKKAVVSLYGSTAGVYDNQAGGFFYGGIAAGGGVNMSYKETRQGWMLALLQHLQADGVPEQDRISAMLVIVRDRLWQPASSGYPYRVGPNFAVYTDHGGPGKSLVVENFVTSEAMGIAGQVLEGAITHAA